MANRDLSPWSRGTGLSPLGGRDPFGSFRREMDRLFDDFFAPVEGRSFAGQPATRNGGAMAALWPSLDVDETDQAYVVTAELPGLDAKDVQLDLKDNALTLSGEKRSEHKEENGGRRYSERSFGRFERTIPFPAEIDADKVEARCANGVLTITLPKNAPARDQARRIQIQGANGEGAAAAPTGAGGAGAATGETGQ